MAVTKLSEKEVCFKEALETYQEKVKDLGVRDHQQWIQDLNGEWHALEKETAMGRLMGWFKRTQRFEEEGTLGEIENMSKPYIRQFRIPDFTVRANGKTLVIDNKFMDADCTKDEWGKKPGLNGNNQRQDYNDINKKNNPGDDKVQDLSLDKDICQCQGEPQSQDAPSPNPDPSGEQSAVAGAVDRLKGTRMPPPGSSGGLPYVESPPIAPRAPQPVRVPEPVNPFAPGRLGARAPVLRLFIP
jgi:hypothetical protein